jgi:hypothetical protein
MIFFPGNYTICIDRIQWRNWLKKT